MTGYISVLGLYTWDSTIFDNLQLPSSVDKDIVINNILDECAELEVLYPNPSYLKEAIGFWSTKELVRWSKLNDTTNLSYNPITDKNIITSELETRDLQGSNINASTNDRTSTNTLDTNAYNSGVGTERETNTIVDDDDSTSNTTTTNTGTIKRDKTEAGNTGSKSIQELIEQERLIDEFNIYNIIINDFKKRFCILIY